MNNDGSIATMLEGQMTLTGNPSASNPVQNAAAFSTNEKSPGAKNKTSEGSFKISEQTHKSCNNGQPKGRYRSLEDEKTSPLF